VGNSGHYTACRSVYVHLQPPTTLPWRHVGVRHWWGEWLRGRTSLSCSRDRPHIDCEFRVDGNSKEMSTGETSSSNTSDRRRQSS